MMVSLALLCLLPSVLGDLILEDSEGIVFTDSGRTFDLDLLQTIQSRLQDLETVARSVAAADAEAHYAQNDEGPTVVMSSDLSWSDETTYESGGSEGTVNGFWGSELTSVSTTVPVPSGATTAELELRYWAIDSWDGGEMASVSVDGAVVWELSRDNCCNDCAPFSEYTGDADIPDPWQAQDDLHCYFDVSATIDVTGMSSFDLTIAAGINSAATDESWGFNQFSVSFNGAESTGSCGWQDLSVDADADAWYLTTGDMIQRNCATCADTHQVIVYKRLTDGGSIDFKNLFLQDWYSSPDGGGNAHTVDFDLYSSYADAMSETNAWAACNFDDPGVGFPRDCGPDGHIGGQWNSDCSADMQDCNDLGGVNSDWQILSCGD